MPSNSVQETAPVTYFVSTFYLFSNLSDLENIKHDLVQKANELGIRGILILGTEGLNTTVSAKSENKMLQFKKWIQDYFNCEGLFFKNSTSDVSPFRKFVVKIRDEIVTTGIPGVVPPKGKNQHLTPTEWNKVMKEENDFVIIDTRNWYEYNIGTFKGAINPDIEKFTDFPKFMESQGIAKDKKMLIFCTGGIRCEKGILELQEQGYNNVYQLEGGIINYMQEYPRDQFEGECFVFDHRVALDQDLKPSKKYKLCPHCGQPGTKQITCSRCDHETIICEKCAEKPLAQETCSKNCAHHWGMHPGKKGPRQIQPFELEQMREKGISLNEIPSLRVTKKKVLRVTQDGHQILESRELR